MQDNANEIWLPVSKNIDPFIDASSAYEVSNMGSVRGRNKRLLAQQVGGRGYATVGLCVGGWTKTFKVHRIVAFTFVIGDFSLEVNHKNCDKLDNRAENLEWISGYDNVRHAMANGLVLRGDSSTGSILTCKAAAEIREKRLAGVKRQILADEYGVSINTIKAVLTGRNWKEAA